MHPTTLYVLQTAVVVIKAACCSLYFPQPALLYKPQLGDINVPGCYAITEPTKNHQQLWAETV